MGWGVGPKGACSCHACKNRLINFIEFMSRYQWWIYIVKFWMCGPLPSGSNFFSISFSMVQECIPVGCVPAARRPHAAVCFRGGCLVWGGLLWGGCLVRGGVCCQGGGCLLRGVGVSALGGFLLRGGIPACTEADTLPPVDRILDTRL